MCLLLSIGIIHHTIIHVALCHLAWEDQVRHALLAVILFGCQKQNGGFYAVREKLTQSHTCKSCPPPYQPSKVRSCWLSIQQLAGKRPAIVCCSHRVSEEHRERQKGSRELDESMPQLIIAFFGDTNYHISCPNTVHTRDKALTRGHVQNIGGRASNISYSSEVLAPSDR